MVWKTLGWIWLLLALLVATPAQATTTIGRGIILEVGKAKDAKGVLAGGDVLTVRLTWSNYGGEGSVVGIDVPADALILLDGKLAQRAEAMKPGHLVKVLVDSSYFEFYTKTGQLPSPRPPSDLSEACYILTLDDAVPMAPLLAAAKQTVAATKAPLLLHLACGKDGIVGAAVIIKGRGARVKGYGAPGADTLLRGAYHEVDARKLSVKDGKLTGEATVRFYGGAKQKHGDREAAPVLPPNGPFATSTYTLDATISADGAVSGAHKGSVEKTQVTGKLAGMASTRAAVPTAYTVWVRPTPRPGQPETAAFGFGAEYIGFKVQDGIVKPDYISGSHSTRVGQVDTGTAALADGVLEAQAKLTLNGKPATLVLTGRVIGDAIFGTGRLTNDAGAVCECRLRGEVLTFDCPSTEGWNEIAHRKVEAQLKAERDAKKGPKP